MINRTGGQAARGTQRRERIHVSSIISEPCDETEKTTVALIYEHFPLDFLMVIEDRRLG